MIPPGVDPGGVGQPPLHGPAGERVQQAALQDHRRRHRPGGRDRPRRPWPSSATRSTVFTFHDSPRRAHSIAAQGGINAAKDYRNDGDSIFRLFYDTIKGGDFRSPRGERLPARAGLERDHRPGDGPGRAVRARVRRAARQPLVRRRAGLAHVLRARADRPAAAARRLSGDDAPGRGGQGQAAHAHRDARRRGRRRPRARDRGARPADAARCARTPRTPSCWPPAATRTRSSCRRTRRRPTRPRSGARTSAARRSRTRASRRSTRPASRSRTTRSPS